MACLLVHYQAIAGLPDRVLDDIADLDRPLAFTREAEADGLLLRVVRERQHFEGLLDFTVHRRIQEAHALQVAHLDGAHAFGAPHVQELAFHRFLADRFLLFSTP